MAISKIGSNSVNLASGLDIADGDITVASGHGLSFASTSDLAGKSSELLDDYEEGTWTPTFSTGSWTYAASRVGLYSKIGDTVVVSATIGWTGTPNAGNTLAVDLPFTIKNVDYYRALGTLGYIDDLDTSDKMLTLSGSANAAFAYFYRLNDNAAPSALNDGSGTGTTGEIQFTFVYRV